MTIKKPVDKFQGHSAPEIGPPPEIGGLHNPTTLPDELTLKVNDLYNRDSNRVLAIEELANLYQELKNKSSVTAEELKDLSYAKGFLDGSRATEKMFDATIRLLNKAMIEDV